jgi:hypothetical protein
VVGAPFEDDAQEWTRTDAVGWANDLPRAQLQGRTLARVLGREGERIHVRS